MTQNIGKIIHLSPFRAFLGIVIIIVSLGYIGYREIQIAVRLAPKNDVIKDAYLLPDDSRVLKTFNRDIVLLQSSKSHPTFAPRDPAFDVQLGTQLELHRIVEFCQWHEQYPTNSSEPIYYKDWSDKIIDSTQFKYSKDHTNSKRNPFPKRDIIPKFTEAGAFKISYTFYEQLDLPSKRYEFRQSDILHFPFPTMQRGFYYASQYWIYSKIEMEGVGEPLKIDGLQWISPEEEEELESNCSAGDIRVGIEYKECPRVMTVVGVQNDDMIMPVRKVSGTYAIAASMNVTADELLDELVLQEGGDLFTLRITCGLGVFVGMFVMYGNFVPFRYVPHWVRCAITAVLSMYILCLGIWIIFYGIDNNSVIKTGLWFISHLILSILINVMYYMIRLYKFALRMEKERKHE